MRSAPWVLPRGDKTVSPVGRWLDARVPGLRALRRRMIYWINEARVIPFTQNPRLVGHPQRKAKAHMKKSGADYRLRRVDAIVLATGFKPFNLTDAVDVVGRGGQSLADLWKDGPHAYHGMTIAGFPNLFLIMGPNTALGHNSILVMIEAQVHAIMQYLGWLDRGELPAVEVTTKAQAAFNASLEEQFERSVWRSSPLVGTGDKLVPPCNGWYRHASGRNHVVWPGSASSYVAAVRTVDISAFRPADDFVAMPDHQPMRRAA